MVQDGRLSTGHARSLVGASDVALQRRLARQIIAKGLSVRETERLIRDALNGKSGIRKTASRKRTDDPNVKAAEARLRRRLGTRVTIQGNVEGVGGRIEIEYYTEQDLDRLYDLLMASAPVGHLG